MKRSAQPTAAPRSLRTRLLIFTSILVVGTGVLLALIAERSGSESLQQVIGGRLAREAGHTADRLSSIVRSERNTLVSFAGQDLMREIRVSDIDKRISSALSTLRAGRELRREYMVIGDAGRAVASSDPARIGTAPRWLAELRGASGGAAVIDGPAHLPGFADEVLLMTTPVPDPDEPARALGLLVGVFDWSLLCAVTGRVRRELAEQGAEAAGLVAGADGVVIGGAFSEGEESAEGVVTGPRPAAPRFVIDVPADRIVGVAALADDLPDWRLVVVESRAHALAPARRLGRRLVVVMGLALAAALVIATIGARRVIQPLTELTRAIRGLSTSEAVAPSVPVRSDDEVGTLAVAFNEMAAELDEAQRHLVEAEKFAFVGELAAGVAHEIRTALGVLGSSAQMLQRSLPGEAGADAQELAGMIRAEVGRLSGVVNDLLTLDRGRPLELEPLRLDEFLRRAIGFVEPQAQEKGVTIVGPGGEGAIEVLGDRELLQQVAINLLVNAIQAQGGPGRVEVSILPPRDGLAGFEVRDDGPGIPESVRQRVFQPFVTGRETGIGLGLTFVQRVVHDHRGTVSLESGEGSGARARVRVPLAETAP